MVSSSVCERVNWPSASSRLEETFGSDVPIAREDPQEQEKRFRNFPNFRSRRLSATCLKEVRFERGLADRLLTGHHSRDHGAPRRLAPAIRRNCRSRKPIYFKEPLRAVFVWRSFHLSRWRLALRWICLRRAAVFTNSAHNADQAV